MDIKNCVGQTPFDVADPDVLRLLEELKKKQNNCSKDRSDLFHTWYFVSTLEGNKQLMVIFLGLTSVHLSLDPQPHQDWARAAEGMLVYSSRISWSVLKILVKAESPSVILEWYNHLICNASNLFKGIYCKNSYRENVYP